MSDIQELRMKVAEAFHQSGVWPVESLVDAVVLIVQGEVGNALEECKREHETAVAFMEKRARKFAEDG